MKSVSLYKMNWIYILYGLIYLSFPIMLWSQATLFLERPKRFQRFVVPEGKVIKFQENNNKYPVVGILDSVSMPNLILVEKYWYNIDSIKWIYRSHGLKPKRVGWDVLSTGLGVGAAAYLAIDLINRPFISNYDNRRFRIPLLPVGLIVGAITFRKRHAKKVKIGNSWGLKILPIMVPY
ncbi:MAG: hypothetical protein EBS07_03265 [Sphingobacteriia bacterium]|nr:hypothetical protein [Sphingobacteriia bacterium]